MALRHHLGPQGSGIHFHTLFNTFAVVDIALSRNAHACRLVSWTLVLIAAVHDRLGTSSIRICHFIASCTGLNMAPSVRSFDASRNAGQITDERLLICIEPNGRQMAMRTRL